MSGFIQFIIALIVVFAIGMVIRSLIRRGKKSNQSGNITVQPQVNIGQNNAQPPQQAPTQQSAFCSNCGAKLDTGSTFCGSCGNKVA